MKLKQSHRHPETQFCQKKSVCFYVYEHPRILPFIFGCVEREREKKIMELLQRNTEKKGKGEKF